MTIHMDTPIDILSLFERDQRRRGLLPNTIEARTYKLTAFLRDHPTGFRVTRQEIELWLDGRNLSAKSRYNTLSHLHCFYLWAVEEGHLLEDPTRSITRPRLRRALPRPITDKDLRRALGSAEPLMKCWLLLGAYQGLRCQEIAGISREDVIEDDDLLRVVHAKGANERMVPLHPAVLQALVDLPMRGSGPVFRNASHGLFTAARVSQKIGEYLDGLGIESSAHALRHWFGTHLYAGSHDLRLTQEMLGHQSPSTTAIYTQFDRRAATSAVQALSVSA